ncbi:MAG: alpha/beta hydrolase [Oscillospiraceae bacterium]|nr:alpha/beta hydrolase [Oscillospiraceae bacterium]
MRADIWYDSQGAGRIHACRWTPEGEPKAVLQIVHGIAEFVERYDDFANYLTSQGFVVVAEDHMGHGQSINGDGIQGYFHGGWFTAVEDTMQLMRDTMQDYPGLPYILFGHSMGSFMARTILCKYPDSGITAAIICGTGWQPAFAMPAVIKLVESVCKKTGETNPNETLQNLIFGSYNGKVEHPRTPYDWLTRDLKIVDAYIAHPLCGFTASAGLLRDMMKGIHYIEQPANLAAMRKDLPVFFIAGGDDPVGSYGKGVRQAASAFRKAGMTDVSVRIYPLCRHEILNEINKEEVYEDVTQWMAQYIKEPAAAESWK